MRNASRCKPLRGCRMRLSAVGRVSHERCNCSADFKARMVTTESALLFAYPEPRLHQPLLYSSLPLDSPYSSLGCYFVNDRIADLGFANRTQNKQPYGEFVQQRHFSSWYPSTVSKGLGLSGNVSPRRDMYHMLTITTRREFGASNARMGSKDAFTRR